MKELYTSPAMTVEELTKADVLCGSTQTNTLTENPDGLNGLDNGNQTFNTLTNFSSML